MIIHNPILTGSFIVNGTDVSSITGSSANLAALNTFTASAATTSSNTFVGNQVVSGSLTVTGSITTPGTLTAQTLVVQTITSSVDFVTGSTRFGSLSSNTHVFTGSLYITGSVGINAASSFRFNGVGDTSHAVGYDSTIDGAFLRGQNGVRFITGTGGGTEVMRINSSGNLQLNFNPGGGNLFFQDTTNGATMFYIIPATYVGSAPFNGNRFLAANSSHISFETGGSERMRITSAGVIGIGTITPSGAYTLTLDGNTSSTLGGISFRQSGTDTFYLGNPTVTNNTDFELWNPRNGYLRFATNNTERIRIINNGNVGIGYEAPDFPLSVWGTNVAQGDATITSHFIDKSSFAAGVGGGISFGGYFAASTYANSFAYIQGIKENSTSGDYAGALKFGTRVNGGSVTERMRITSAGNVNVSNLLLADRLSLTSFTSLYGKKVVKADAVSSFTFNLSTMFPEMSSTFSTNVIGCFGMYTIFRGGAAETGIFSLSRNSGLSWSNGAYTVQTATGAYSLSSVTASGTSITMNFNTTVYVMVEVTVMIE